MEVTPILGELKGGGSARISRSLVFTSPRLGKVETIEIHDLVPRSDEVPHKCFLRVIACIDFRNGAELGACTEYKISAGYQSI